MNPMFHNLHIHVYSVALAMDPICKNVTNIPYFRYEITEYRKATVSLLHQLKSSNRVIDAIPVLCIFFCHHSGLLI